MSENTFILIGKYGGLIVAIMTAMFTTITLVLNSHKDEIWNTVSFKDEKWSKKKLLMLYGARCMLTDSTKDLNYHHTLHKKCDGGKETKT